MWGNISTVAVTAPNGTTKTTRYLYDGANQLIREDNQAEGKTWTWTYDGAGNILNKKTYNYTTGTLGAVISTINYGYSTTDANGDGKVDWGDKLVSFNGKTIGSDAIGNMTYDGTWTYTWEHGRQLKAMKGTGGTWVYSYDANGMRTQRSNGSTTYEYVYNGSQLKKLKVGGNTLLFQYGTTGMPVGLTYNNARYYYVTNLQGDVIAILNSNRAAVVTYTYDAWGNILTTTDNSGFGLAAKNPLRYRGYVYDNETGLYYLQSRYYNPAMGRFINADALVSTGQGILGYNMFLYCGNNAVLNIDMFGTRHEISAGAGGIPAGPGGSVSLGDIIWDHITNEDISAALDDDFINFYKGVPVFKIQGMGTSGCSFGVIFVGEYADATTLKHEYGHIVQLREIGLGGYINAVAIPSVVCFWARKEGYMSWETYYNLPFEKKADEYGGVERDCYYPGSDKLSDIYWLLVRIMTHIAS